MLFLYGVVLAVSMLMLAAGVVEQRRHQAALQSIPVRILVNGIRGKSSITRLCAGALRGGGLVTTAKTTGTAARFLHPDGTEEPVYRKFGIANVSEQIGVVRKAASYAPHALVVECMAVQPDLQELNQAKLIQSTIGVLSNVRADHLAEMGPTLDDVARSLSRSMPVGGICVTTERERLPILRAEARKRRCRLIEVDPEMVTDEEMRGFGWVTFKENVAIALIIARLLKVDRAAALRGMWAAPPDPGVLRVRRFVVDGRSLRFANVFAANDPASTLMNIDQLRSQGAIGDPVHVVINCRPDRIERNRQMGELVGRIAPERVVLIGEPTRSAYHAVPRGWQHVVTDLGGRRSGRELLRGIVQAVDSEVSVVAIGNIHGQGEALLDALSTLPATAVSPTGAAPAVLPSAAPSSAAVSSAAVSSAAVSSAAVSLTAAPSAAAPSAAAPFAAAPPVAPPPAVLPSTALPSTAPPSTAPPSTALPSTALPSTALPSTAPSSTAPSSTALSATEVSA